VNLAIRRLANNANVQVLVGLMWSFSATTVKDLTGPHHLDIFFISAVRSIFGFGFLLPLILVKWDSVDENFDGKDDNLPLPNFARIRAVMLLGAIALATNTFCLCWAFQHTAALTPMYMHFAGVLLVAPCSRLVFGYKPTRREWLAAALTLAGITVLLFHGLSFDQPLVVAVSAGAGITQLIGQLCSGWLNQTDERIQRRTGEKQSHGPWCFMANEIFTVVVGLIVSLTTTSSLSHVNSHAMLELVFLGVVTWGIPNFLAILAQRSRQIIWLGLFWVGDPIFVPTWPVLFGQDPMPPPASWLGAGIILIALVVKKIEEVRKEKEKRARQQASRDKQTATHV